MKTSSTMKLFLDDIRCPSQCASYMHTRIGSLNPIYLQGGWYIVRSFEEFQDAIGKYHMNISHVSFDHDLADIHYHESMDDVQRYEAYLKGLGSYEKTGYECAVWMKRFYDENNLQYPYIFIHSMNPSGVHRIASVFKTKDESR